MFVALRKESVDRNLLRGCRDSVFERVALRKESVDRNIGVGTTRDSFGVALRKESVDRNRQALVHCEEQTESLSARRAWIEIKNSGGVGSVRGGRSPQGERG